MIKIRPHLFETNSSSTDAYYDEYTEKEVIEEERGEWEIDIIIDIKNKLIYNMLDYVNTSSWHGDASGIFDDIFYDSGIFDFDIDEDASALKTELNKDYTAFTITFDLLSSRTIAYTTHYEYHNQTEDGEYEENFDYDFSKVDTKKIKEELLSHLFEYTFDDDYGGYDEFIEKYKNIDITYLESLKNDWLNDKIDYDKIPLEIDI